ncbi:hypothetical protein TRVL_03663 [Trypanosoma vivax]|nr:hypothetical protein TRVL_03663 [Trypanosoma vivax]
MLSNFRKTTNCSWEFKNLLIFFTVLHSPEAITPSKWPKEVRNLFLQFFTALNHLSISSLIRQLVPICDLHSLNWTGTDECHPTAVGLCNFPTVSSEPFETQVVPLPLFCMEHFNKFVCLLGLCIYLQCAKT